MNQNKPNFLVIGVQKAATSWLWVQLRKHPDIWLPPIKELHFFDHKFVEENRSWTKGHIFKGVKDCLQWQVNRAPSFNPSFLKYLLSYADEDIFSEEWYLRIFERPSKSKKLGDVTPEYCTIPESGIEYAKSLLGDIPIIMIVRDPVKRALSQIRMNISRSKQDIDKLSVEGWMENTKERALYNRAQYSEYLPRWEKYFSNILYVPYQQVAKKPQRVMSDIFQHIGVNDMKMEGLKNKVHVGQSAKVPKEIVAYFEQAFAEEQVYLKSKFDSKFLASI